MDCVGSPSRHIDNTMMNDRKSDRVERVGTPDDYDPSGLFRDNVDPDAKSGFACVPALARRYRASAG
jgi:hypothetical protein